MDVNSDIITFPSPQPQSKPETQPSVGPAQGPSQAVPTSVKATTAQPGRRKQAKPQKKPGKTEVEMSELYSDEWLFVVVRVFVRVPAGNVAWSPGQHIATIANHTLFWTQSFLLLLFLGHKQNSAWSDDILHWARSFFL